MNSHTEQHELEILNSIHLNEDATQRELSEKVGLSLGAINLIIKRLTKKGFIKVVHLSSHSIKYFLTPEGIANKLERTYQYIARTYKEILALQTSITQAISDELTFHDTDEVLFYGHEDEFKQLITDILKEEFSIPPTAIFTRPSSPPDGNNQKTRNLHYHLEHRVRAADQKDPPQLHQHNAQSEPLEPKKNKLPQYKT